MLKLLIYCCGQKGIYFILMNKNSIKMNFNQMNINQSDGVSSILLFFILKFCFHCFCFNTGLFGASDKHNKRMAIYSDYNAINVDVCG